MFSQFTARYERPLWILFLFYTNLTGMYRKCSKKKKITQNIKEGEITERIIFYFETQNDKRGLVMFL